MFEELVLLDILNRLDPYAYVDAVVGVVATGEVRLWQYSLNHLRYNYCDFRRPLKRGENFWFAKLQQFYSDRGLLYLVQRLIPRDLDAPKNRFADNKVGLLLLICLNDIYAYWYGVYNLLYTGVST